MFVRLFVVCLFGGLQRFCVPEIELNLFLQLDELIVNDVTGRERAKLFGI